MRFLLLAIAVYLAAVLQTTLVEAMRIGQITPDLLVLAALVWLLAGSGRYGFLAAGLVGLALDLLGPGRVGIGTAWMLIVGYVLTRFKSRFGADHWLVQVPMVAVATVAWAASTGLTRWLLGEVAIGPASILQRAVGVGLYTAAVSLPVLLVLGWLRESSLVRQKKLAEF